VILVEIKPRQDDLFDIWAGDEGDHLVNSHQGYENVEDAVKIARRLFAADERVAEALRFIGEYGDVGNIVASIADILRGDVEPVALRITYRTGKTHTEQIR